MAEIIGSEFWNGKLWQRHPSREIGYAELFDGQTRMLVRGTDFHTELASFRSVLYSAANRLGVKLHTCKLSETGLVVWAEKP